MRRRHHAAPFRLGGVNSNFYQTIIGPDVMDSPSCRSYRPHDYSRRKGPYMRRTVPGGDRISFFFSPEAPNYCRLCMKDVRRERNAKENHVGGRSGLYDSHANREIALDNLISLGLEGHNLDVVEVVWSELLLRCPRYYRIPHLTSPFWSLEKRADKIRSLIRLFQKIGIVKYCFLPSGDPEVPQSTKLGFELLECVGDCWGTSMTERISMLFPDKRWCYGEHHTAFENFALSPEMNINLRAVFTLLQLGDFLPEGYLEAKDDTEKVRADVVEALIGELLRYNWDFESQRDVAAFTPDFPEVNGEGSLAILDLVKHTLNEVYDVVALHCAFSLLNGAVPLARETVLDNKDLHSRTLKLASRPVSFAGGSSVSSSKKTTPIAARPTLSLKPNKLLSTHGSTSFSPTERLSMNYHHVVDPRSGGVSSSNYVFQDLSPLFREFDQAQKEVHEVLQLERFEDAFRCLQDELLRGRPQVSKKQPQAKSGEGHFLNLQPFSPLPTQGEKESMEVIGGEDFSGDELDFAEQLCWEPLAKQPSR